MKTGILTKQGVTGRGGVISRSGGILTRDSARITGTALPGATLTGTAAGPWYLDTGAGPLPIPGATGRTLVVPWGARPGHAFSQAGSNTAVVPGAMWDWTGAAPAVAGLATAGTSSRASTARYWNADGILSAAAVHTPRTDHDPVTHARRGLLMEAQATNLLLRSDNFTNTAAWGTNGVTNVADQAVAPDGNITGDIISEQAVNSEHTTGQNFNATSGATHTASCFFKATGLRNRAAIFLGSVSHTAQAYATFDLTGGGAVGETGSSAVAGIIPCGDGWYRCWIRAQAVATTTTSVQLAVRTDLAGRTQSYPGVAGQGIIAWGAQVETGALTSYIPTVASQVTRQADSLAIQSLAGFTWAAGVFVAEAGIQSPVNTVATDRNVLHTSTDNHRLVIRLGDNVAAYPQSRVGTGSAVVNGTAGTAAATADERLVLGYRSGGTPCYFARKTGPGTAAVSTAAGSYSGQLPR